MRIILIDDDQLVTLSLKTILESTGSVQVLATGTSGAEAIALYQQWKPDVLLLDIQMPNGSGLDAGEQILQQDPNARILFLTTFSDDAYIAKALELGAKGYLLKQDFAGIVPALEAVMQGQHVFGEQVVSCFSKQFKKKSTFDYAKYDITEKEQEIIAQVAKGYSNNFSRMLRHSVSVRERFGIISAAFWKNCSCVTAHSWRFTTIITKWTCKIPKFV